LFRRLLISTLFPYTTLFRSVGVEVILRIHGCPRNTVDDDQRPLGGRPGSPGNHEGAGGRSRRSPRQAPDEGPAADIEGRQFAQPDRKSTRLNSSHLVISYAV